VKFVPLKNVLTFIRGVTFKPDDLLEQGDKDSIVCLRTKNIQKELDLTDVMVIPTSIIEKNDAKILQKSDILISSANSWQLVGKCVRVPELPFPATLGGFISNLRAKPEVVNANYLYHWLVSPNIQHEIRHLGRQTTNISNLDRVRFLELKIPLPPLETQKQIAQVLETADQLRKDCQQVEQELNALAQSVFLEMFGDPVTNPNKFPIAKLSDAYINAKEGTKCGPFGSALKKEEYTESGIPVWVMDNIQKSSFAFNKCLFIDHEKFLSLNNYSTQSDDIIISRAGTVGKMCIIPDGYTQAIISTNLIRLRLNNKVLLPLFFVLLMKYFSNKVGRIKTGAEGAFTHMNTGVLNDLTFPFPPMNLQIQFSKTIQLIEQQKLQNKEKSQQLDNLFNTLLQKAFKGELNLKSSEQA